MEVFEGLFFHGMIQIVYLFFLMLILIWLLEELSDLKDRESSQLFHEPDPQQLAEINFFVEDFGFDPRALLFVFVELWGVFLLVTYYQSVDKRFFESLI